MKILPILKLILHILQVAPQKCYELCVQNCDLASAMMFASIAEHEQFRSFQLQR